MYKILILISLFIISCNPVKRVLNNQKKFEIVAQEVVKRGYCINDTIIIDSSRIDTVVKQNYIIDTVTINKNFNIDTLLKSGAYVSIKDGVLSVKCPSSKEVTKIVKQTQYIRDLKLESILKSENIFKSDSIKELSIQLKEQKILTNKHKLEAVKQKFKFIILLIVIGLLIIIYTIGKFKLL